MVYSTSEILVAVRQELGLGLGDTTWWNIRESTVAWLNGELSDAEFTRQIKPLVDEPGVVIDTVLQMA